MLKITSRKEARAQGLKRYFTGKACPKGHTAERYVSNWVCVDCQAEYKRTPEAREYNRTPEYREANRARMARQHARRVGAARLRRGGVCQECGATEDLHFHHRDPSTKVGNVSKMAASAPLESFWAEVGKCDLLCQACHREAHRRLDEAAEVAA